MRWVLSLSYLALMAQCLLQIATQFVTLGFFCLLLPLSIITPEVRMWL